MPDADKLSDPRPLVGFLYDLLCDAVPAGQLAAYAVDNTRPEIATVVFERDGVSTHLGRIAIDLADRLSPPPPPPLTAADDVFAALRATVVAGTPVTLTAAACERVLDATADRHRVDSLRAAVAAYQNTLRDATATFKAVEEKLGANFNSYGELADAVVAKLDEGARAKTKAYGLEETVKARNEALFKAGDEIRALKADVEGLMAEAEEHHGAGRVAHLESVLKARVDDLLASQRERDAYAAAFGRLKDVLNAPNDTLVGIAERVSRLSSDYEKLVADFHARAAALRAANQEVHSYKTVFGMVKEAIGRPDVHDAHLPAAVSAVLKEARDAAAVGGVASQAAKDLRGEVSDLTRRLADRAAKHKAARKDVFRLKKDLEALEALHTAVTADRDALVARVEHAENHLANAKAAADAIKAIVGRPLIGYAELPGVVEKALKSAENTPPEGFEYRVVWVDRGARYSADCEDANAVFGLEWVRSAPARHASPKYPFRRYEADHVGVSNGYCRSLTVVCGGAVTHVADLYIRQDSPDAYQALRAAALAADAVVSGNKEGSGV